MRPLVYKTKGGAYGLSLDGESVINARGRLVPCDPEVWTEVPNGDPSLASDECRAQVPVVAKELETKEKLEARRIEKERLARGAAEEARYHARVRNARRMNEANEERRKANSPLWQLWRYFFGE